MTELLASASRSFVRLLASHEERSGQDGHSIMEIVAGEKETYNNWEGDGKNLPRLDVRIFRPRCKLCSTLRTKSFIRKVRANFCPTLVFQYAGTNGSMRISFFLENGSRDWKSLKSKEYFIWLWEKILITYSDISFLKIEEENFIEKK